MLLQVVGVVSSLRTGERVLAEVDNDIHRKLISEIIHVFDVPQDLVPWRHHLFCYRKDVQCETGSWRGEAEKPEANVLWNGAEGLLRDF